jgi:hypothetical protein
VHREWLERVHVVKPEHPAAEPMRAFEHHPVLRFPGGEIREFAFLIVEPEVGVRVSHPLPSGAVGHRMRHARHVRHAVLVGAVLRIDRGRGQKAQQQNVEGQ